MAFSFVRGQSVGCVATRPTSTLVGSLSRAGPNRTKKVSRAWPQWTALPAARHDQLSDWVRASCREIGRRYTSELQAASTG